MCVGVWTGYANSIGSVFWLRDHMTETHASELKKVAVACGFRSFKCGPWRWLHRPAGEPT